MAAMAMGSEDDRGAVGSVRASRIKAIVTVALPLIGFGAAAAVLRGGRMVPPGSGARLPVPESLCPVTRRESGFACSGGAARKRARRQPHRELGFNVSAAEMVGQMRDEVAAFSCDFARDPPRSSVWPPTEPTILSNVTAGWPASHLSRADFLKHFEGWRLPLSTFLRDCWLALCQAKRPVSGGSGGGFF